MVDLGIGVFYWVVLLIQNFFFLMKRVDYMGYVSIVNGVYFFFLYFIDENCLLVFNLVIIVNEKI